MAEFQMLAMAEVIEPELPVRVAMDEGKLKDLMTSMEAIGLLEPIITVARKDGYEIVDGHRRYLAARELKWEAIQAMVFTEKGLAKHAAMLHANVYREDITAAEEAELYAELMEREGLTFLDLCQLVRQSEHYVGTRLNLYNGRKEVYEAVRDRKISMAQAVQINRFQDDKLALYWLTHCQLSGYSANRIAQAVAEEQPPTTPPPPTPSLEEQVAVGVQPEVPAIECVMCGGNRDPYNMKVVYIHTHCNADLQRVMRAAAERLDEAQ